VVESQEKTKSSTTKIGVVEGKIEDVVAPVKKTAAEKKADNITTLKANEILGKVERIQKVSLLKYF
jgi:hypothetical protein